MTQQKYKVSEALKNGEVTTLFGAAPVPSPSSLHNSDLVSTDYMADSVDAFLTEHTSADSPTTAAADSYLPLGLTFSFPVEQTALDEGFLLTWTKGFAAKNAIGKDVVKLLQNAFDRKHLHVKCVALVNDVSILLYLSRVYPPLHAVRGRRASAARDVALGQARCYCP